MKLSIIAILISFSAICYGQGRYADEAKAAREKTNQMLQEDIDRLTHPIGHIIIDQHDMSVGSADLIWYDPMDRFIEVLTGYLESRDSVEVHFIPGDVALCALIYPECNLPDHRKTVIQTPTFQGFINYVLNQKP